MPVFTSYLVDVSFCTDEGQKCLKLIYKIKHLTWVDVALVHLILFTSLVILIFYFSYLSRMKASLTNPKTSKLPWNCSQWAQVEVLFSLWATSKRICLYRLTCFEDDFARCLTSEGDCSFNGMAMTFGAPSNHFPLTFEIDNVQHLIKQKYLSNATWKIVDKPA